MSKVNHFPTTVSELSKLTGWPVTTIYRMIARRTARASRAVQLEAITGIPRERFVWPDHYGDPWPDLVQVREAVC